MEYTNKTEQISKACNLVLMLRRERTQMRTDYSIELNRRFVILKALAKFHFDLGKRFAEEQAIHHVGVMVAALEIIGNLCIGRQELNGSKCNFRIGNRVERFARQVVGWGCLRHINVLPTQ